MATTPSFPYIGHPLGKTKGKIDQEAKDQESKRVRSWFVTDRIDFPPACTRNTATHERVLILHFIAGVFMQPIASLFSPFAAPPSVSFYTIHGVSFLFFFLPATPAGIALFSPPFFMVRFFFFFVPSSFLFFFWFLSSFSSFYPLITFYLFSFIDGRSYLHSRVFLWFRFPPWKLINSFRREMKKGFLRIRRNS